jgi:uncharacterized protein (DUF1697 family)
MPELRAALAGFDDVQTYVQSGNVVLSSDRGADEVRDELEALIAERFGFEVPVVMRTGEELAEVVRRNPLREVVENPKLYLVTFLGSPAPVQRVEEVAGLARGGEQLAARGREIYSWHPDGAARSKLWAKLAGTGLGITGTSRNWSTVTRLAEMANQE